jgi:dihydrodipicolinate synthase/N-acetylneuraminate lyase
MPGPLHGALAAAVTPLADGGDALDLDAIGPYVDVLAGGGLDGILAMGTTGEGVMLSVEERRRVAEAFVSAAAGRFAVAVHCGAQTTRETVELAAHAAGLGADAVAVICPPYFPFDADGLAGHLRAAAEACAPAPFYVYEFAARTGYAVPLEVIARLEGAVDNLAGLKVSDAPFEALEPYLLDGLDVLVGNEPLVPAGLEKGAVGAISGIASALPEPIVELVRGTPGAAERVEAIKALALSLPSPGVFKAILGMRGVPVGPDVRAPLRRPSEAELDRLAAGLRELGLP